MSKTSSAENVGMVSEISDEAEDSPSWAQTSLLLGKFLLDHLAHRHFRMLGEDKKLIFEEIFIVHLNRYFHMLADKIGFYKSNFSAS